MKAEIRTAVRYSIVIALGGFVFGFDATVISGVLGFVEKDFDLTPAQIGVIFAWTGLAALASSATIGIAADFFGRKRALQFLAILYTISALFSALAWDFQSLVIARAIGGYAFGSLVIAPVYIAEISPASIRGRLGAINQLNIVVGLSSAYFVNLLLLRLSSGDSAFADLIGLSSDNVWNWMLGVELIPAMAWLVLISLIPKSPRWLATRGRWDEARKVLSKLVSPDEIEAALEGIKENLGGVNATFGEQLKAIFTRKMAYILIVSVIIAVVQMITGINAVFFFAPTVFELSGVGQDAAFVQAVSVGLTNVVFTLIAMSLIDMVGRKPLMLIGLACAAISLGVVAYGFQSATYTVTSDTIAALDGVSDDHDLSGLLNQTYTNDVKFKTAVADATSPNFMRDNEAEILKNAMTANPKLILAGILGFVASFAISLGPIMWVFLSEIFPVRVRGVAIGLVTIFNSATSTLVTTLFPTVVAGAGIATVFFIFCGWAIAGLILLAFLMPETKGMSLEEIEQRYIHG